MDNTGLIAAGVVLLLGSAFGVWRRRTDGTLRAVTAPPEAAVAAGVPVSTVPAPAAPESETPKAAMPVGAGSGGVGPGGVGLAGPGSGAAGLDAAGADGPGPEDVGSGGGGPEPGALGAPIDAALLAGLGVRPAAATLLQFSSAFCAPCRAVRRISSEVAAMVPQVQHVEVDAESHLDAVRALGVWRTPTLLVLDADGQVVKRATGVPGKAQLIAVLGEILPTS